jgi:CubicO group peptidase (beta-lactamase class C family)
MRQLHRITASSALLRIAGKVPAVLLLSAQLGQAAEHGPAAKASPEEQKHFQAAAEYSRAQHGVSMLVMRRGEILFEDYAPGWDEKPHLLASGTKSFCGVMAACAVQDGLLKLDEKVSGTLTEWQGDSLKSGVTIRQLLSLSSGIEGGDNGSVPGYAAAVKLATARAAPGERFSYGPIPFQCFGEVMRRKLAPRNETVEAYLKRRVIDPIGLRVGYWRKDADGNINLPAGAFLIAREWVKFGELIRQRGKWNGKAIVPADLLAECFKPASANPAYGLTFWLLGGDTTSTALADGKNADAKARRALDERRQLGFTPPRDLVAAMGKGKQRCYIIPSLELVIVRLGDSEGREFSDDAFLSRLLAK